MMAKGWPLRLRVRECHLRIAAKLALPKAVADDRHGIGADLFLRQERAAGSHANSKGGEVVGRRHLAHDQPGFRAAREVDADAGIKGERGKYLILIAIIAVICQRTAPKPGILGIQGVNGSQVGGGPGPEGGRNRTA